MLEYRTSCGGTIRVLPKTVEHLKAHPEVTVFLNEAIGLLSLPRRPAKLESVIDLGKAIGRSNLLPTPAVAYDEAAMFAMRHGRRSASRVVEPNNVGPTCSTIVVIAKPTPIPETYDLLTSWIGKLACKEPWDLSIRSEEERNKCLAFWRSHALIHDSKTMSKMFQSSWQKILSESREPCVRI